MNENPTIHGRRRITATGEVWDAEINLMKAAIAAEITATLDKRRLTARAPAKTARVDAADIRRIRNGELSRFTLGQLVRVAYRLGLQVELNIEPERAGAAA